MSRLRFKAKQVRKVIEPNGMYADDCIELRWMLGQHWGSAHAVPEADWKMLCRLARMLKKNFQKYLDELE